MAKCPFCAGTDVQHEAGEPCLWEEMERGHHWREEQEHADQAAYEEQYRKDYGDA